MTAAHNPTSRSEAAMSTELSSSKQQSLLRYQHDYHQLKQELVKIGFVLQGSLTERRMQCGKPTCRCRREPKARHGPYYQWSWKDKGRTASVYLNQQQAERCREWIANQRELERVIQRMHHVSLRISRLYGIRQK
jgi:hypothetical protein